MEYEKYIYYSYDLFDGDIISFKAKHINNSYFIKNNWVLMNACAISYGNFVTNGSKHVSQASMSDIMHQLL